MKKLTLIVFAAAGLALAGCDNNKGGTGDQYNTGSGTSSGTSSGSRDSSSGPSPNSPQNSATSPGGVSTNSSPRPR